MSKFNLGVIGLGTMGGIIAQSLIKQKFDAFEKYVLFDVDSEKIKQFNNYSNVICAKDIPDVVSQSDFLLLAVKPQIMEKVLIEISKCNYEKKTIISIAAGLKIAFYRKFISEKAYFIRVMPNILFTVNEGAAGIVLDPNLPKNYSDIVQGIFKTSGKIILCDENKIDAVTGLSGSGPAYIFMIIEAMADGAVKMGIPRKDAYLLAAQTVVGAGKMVLENNTNPGVLKDMVCTPGGTTIEGISVLERGGLRGILIDAIEAATKKSQSLSG
jgi:pyrroline-5-carboxylate reductase